MIGSQELLYPSLTVAAPCQSRDREGAFKFLQRHQTGFGTPAILALSLALGSCVPWTVRPIDGEKEAPAGPAALSPAAYVDSIWTAKLAPAVLNAAVDARTLLDALVVSPEDAEARYGHRETNGPVYFIVKGTGVVTSVDTRSRGGLALVDVAPFDRRPDLSIQIGPVLRGTSLRDATGIVRFTDFVNQLQFADVGNELNDRVLRTVLAPWTRPVSRAAWCHSPARWRRRGKLSRRCANWSR